MGRQQKLKQQRKLEKIKAGVMLLIYSDPVMKEKLQEITELQKIGTAQSIIAEKVQDLSLLVESAVLQQQV